MESTDPLIRIETERFPEDCRSTIRLSKIIGGRLFSQKVQISDRQALFGSHITDAMKYAMESFKYQCLVKEAEMATTTASPTYAGAMRYFTTATSEATTATTSSYHRHYTNSATAATTSSTVTWSRDNRIFYRRAERDDNMVWLDNLWIKKSDLTHAQRMQLQINRKWSAHCASETYEEQKKHRIARARAAKAAEDKALLLLESFIGEEEIERYKKTGQVYVKGKNGLYLAKKGGGVSKIEGKRLISFCVYTNRKYKCPPTDDVIALKTMLEYDDEKVIQIANRMGSKEVEELPLAACM